MFQRSLLSDADVERLTSAAFTVLDKVGLLCQNTEILRALAAFGARVDEQAGRAAFPPELSRGFVEQIRREAHAPDPPADAAFTPPGQTQVSTQIAQFFYDDEQAARRSGNRQDFLTLVQLGEALHPDRGVGHALTLTETPPMIEPLEAGLLLAEHASKPGKPFAWHVRQADYLLEMGDIMGVPDWFTWGANCLAHPLRFDKDSADKFVARMRARAGASLTAMPVVGVSTPVTLAGFVAVCAAEFLAVWMAGRALNPGARLGGSMWAGTLDMRAGEVSYCAFDAMLYGFAAVEFMRRLCGVAVQVGGGEYCDAKTPGLYAAIEKAYKAMTIAAFSGRHPGVGDGLLEEGKTISAAQLLIDRDMAAAVGVYGRTLESSDQALALDTVLDVGFGLDRNYLEMEHTLSRFRECLWMPRLISRSGWDGPECERALLLRAQQQARELLAAYRKPDKDPDMLARMRRVLDRARKELL